MIKESIQELHDRVHRNTTIVNGLEKNDAFKLLVDDFKATAKRLDDSWQWIQEEKVLQQAQITKMATLSIINAIDNYKYDIKVAQERLVALENQDEIQIADFDNEGVDNE